MKRGFRVVLVLGALAAIGGAIWLLSFRSDRSRELRAAAAAFLTRASDGRASEAYAQAADAFRISVDRGVFLLMVDDMNAALGAFQKIARIESSRVTKGKQATGAELVVDAVFEKQVLRAEFHFVRQDGGWRVVGFELHFPENFWPGPDPAALERASAEFLGWLGAGDLGPMYASFYPIVQSSWKPSQFDADMKRLRASCGAMLPASPRIVGTNDAEETLVEIPVTCADGAPFIARLKWTWLRGRWRLLGMSWSPSADGGHSPPPGGGHSPPSKTP